MGTGVFAPNTTQAHPPPTYRFLLKPNRPQSDGRSDAQLSLETETVVLPNYMLKPEEHGVTVLIGVLTAHRE